MQATNDRAIGYDFPVGLLESGRLEQATNSVGLMELIKQPQSFITIENFCEQKINTYSTTTYSEHILYPHSVPIGCEKRVQRRIRFLGCPK